MGMTWAGRASVPWRGATAIVTTYTQHQPLTHPANAAHAEVRGVALSAEPVRYRAAPMAPNQRHNRPRRAVRPVVATTTARDRDVERLEAETLQPSCRTGRLSEGHVLRGCW